MKIFKVGFLSRIKLFKNFLKEGFYLRENFFDLTLIFINVMSFYQAFTKLHGTIGLCSFGLYV